MSNSDGSIIIDTELDSSGFDKGSDKMLKSIQGLTAEIDRLGENVSKSLGAAMRNGFSNANSVLKFKDTLDQAEAKATELQGELEKLGQSKVPTQDYQDLIDELDKAESKLTALLDRQEKMEAIGVKENSAQWRSLAYDIEQAEKDVSRYESRISDYEGSGQAYVSGSDTEEYANLKKQLDVANQEIEKGKALIDAETLAQAQLNVQAAQEAVIRAQSDEERAAALEQVRAAQEELKGLAAQQSAAGGGGEDPIPEPEEKISALERLGAAALKVTANLAKMVGGGVLAGLKKLGSTALDAAKKLGKMAGKAIINGLGKMKEKVSSLVGANKQASLTSKGLVKALTSVKTMLASRVKRMFISYLMSEIKQSMSALVQYSNEFDKSISGMRNATSELGANLAVSFSNLVNAVAPAITTIINLLSKAASYMSAFFSMIGGKSTVTVAKKQTDSYADSLKNATGAAKDAEKARKALGFDELNVLSKDKDSSEGGSGSDTKDIYEDVPIDQLLPEDVASWFDSIKSAFENGDWEGIGKAFTTGLNGALAKAEGWIDTVLKPFGVTWASRIAQVLNGAVSGLNWKGVGSTLGAGINALAATVDTFLATFNFQNLGAGLAQAVNGLFDKVNWNALGATFGHSWQALVATVYGFVTTADWAGIGQGISDFIEGWFYGIDWGMLASAIGVGFNGVVTSLHTIITETDWAGMATTLGTSINNLVDTIDWAELGNTISDGFIGAFSFLNTFVETINWQQLGKDIFAALAAIDWNGVADAIFEGIGAALGALAGFLWGLIQEAWDSVVSWWKDVAFEDGKFTLLGLLDGIVEAIANIGAWIVDHIFKPFMDGFKKAFGIHSPSTVMAEMGGFIVEGLLGGITGVWDTVTGFFTGAVDGIKSILSGAWDSIKSTASTAWNGIKDTVTGAFNGAKEFLGRASENIKTGLSNTWNSVKTTASAAWNGVKSTVSTAFTGLKTGLVNTATQIKDSIGSKWDAIKTAASSKWNDLKSTVSGLWNNLKSDMSSTEWSSIGSNLVAGVKSGISNSWSQFSSWVGNKFNGLVDTAKSKLGIHSPSTVFAEIGEFLDAGLMVGIQAGEKDILRTVSNLAGNVTDTMNDVDPEIEIASNATLAGMDNVAGVLGGIADKFAAIANALTSMGSLKVPAIVAGTVLPYQTRVNSNGKDDFTSTLEASNEELISVIIQSVNNATSSLVNAIQANGGTVVMLDINSLTTGVVNEINSRTLRSGKSPLMA